MTRHYNSDEEIKNVKLRTKKNSFSSRSGELKTKNIQIDDFDESTRNVLNTKCIDILYCFWEQKYGRDRNEDGRLYQNELESFIGNFLINNVLALSHEDKKNFSTILNNFNYVFEKGSYNNILDVIEIIVENVDLKKRNLYSEFNTLFEDYFIGYRFINNLLCPISNEIEKKEIECAFSTKYEKVNIHIIKALELLSDRDNPDYHNSIKESYTAIESLGNITGDGGVYSNMKKLIEPKKNISNKLLYESIEKFIHFVNEEPGVRHDNNNESHNISFDEAKFCLVIASGIINYLLKYIEGNSI